MQQLGTSVRLQWEGKDREGPSPEVRLQLARRGDPDCVLLQGDNLAVMRALAHKAPGPYMLAYLDPPFLTGRQHLRVTRKRRGRSRVERTLRPAFDDRWEGLNQYLSELRPRIVAARDLLDDHGCLVVHIDPKTSHYVKVLCDEIFGLQCFASEIVWRYRRWPSKTENFQRVHDVLLRYVKRPGVRPRFHQLYEPLAPSTRATWGVKQQRAVVGAGGRRLRSSTTETQSPGTPLGDVWEIGIVAPVARERTGYPTQKPEALLERLLLACTEPRDLVLDPYVGSGTTLAVCHRLNRRSVGIDNSIEAIDVTRTRLAGAGVSPLVERCEALEVSPGVRRARPGRLTCGQARDVA